MRWALVTPNLEVLQSTVHESWEKSCRYRVRWWEVVRKVNQRLDATLTHLKGEMLQFVGEICELEEKSLKTLKQIYHWLILSQKANLLAPHQLHFFLSAYPNQVVDLNKQKQRIRVMTTPKGWRSFTWILIIFLSDFHYKANHLCYGCLILSLSSNGFHLGTHQKG